MLNNLYVGSFINDNLILGITNEGAVSDYIEEGYNAVRDSLNVSNCQLFFRCYVNNFFLLMKMPPFTNYSNIAINDKISIGGGYVIYTDKTFAFELSYHRLLSSNQNGFNKGKLNLGFSSSISRLSETRNYKNLYGYSILPSFFYSILNWINTPLAHGYKQSL